MDANRGKRKARPANSVRRTRLPDGTQRPAVMWLVSDRTRQASHPSYGARHVMTFGTSTTAQGNLGRPTAREAVEQGPQPHIGTCESVEKSHQARAWWCQWMEASIRTRTNSWHSRPFRLARGGTGSCPTCRTRCFGVELRSTAACPAKEQKGRVSREVAGSGRGQSSEGRNPMDVARMKQAWQVRKARREEGP